MSRNAAVSILVAGLVLLLAFAGAGAAGAYHLGGMQGGFPVVRLGGGDKDEEKANEVEGAVTDISGTSITIKTPSGTSVVVIVSSTTTFTKEKQPAGLSDIQVGDKVEAKGTRNTDGTFDTTSLKIKSPKAHEEGDEAEGQVTEVSGMSIMLETKSGSSVTALTSATTTFTRGKQESSLLDVHVGDNIEAKGSRNADSTFSAASVKIKLPKIEGSVTSVTGPDLSVDTKDGVRLVHSNASTTVTNEKQPSSLADVTAGVRVEAKGSLNADGSLTATSIEIKKQEPEE